jgi:hypothetical protein
MSLYGKWLLFFDQSQSQSHQLFENQQYNVAQAPKWHRDQTVMSYVGKKVNSRNLTTTKITRHMHGIFARTTKNKPQML